MPSRILLGLDFAARGSIPPQAMVHSNQREEQEYLLLLPEGPPKQTWLQLLKHLLVTLSLLLNLWSLLIILGSKSSTKGAVGFGSSDNWIDGAAKLAKEVSKVSCSGHGRAFLDTVDVDQAKCECNACFTGQHCSTRMFNCTADANSGDPLYLEPFWEVNQAAGALVVSPTYRMGYEADLTELEELIRRVHSLAKNAVTEGKYILLGTGSMQLINAAIASLAPDNFSSPALVVSESPYYMAYKGQTEFFASRKYRWGGEPAEAARLHGENSTVFIEIMAAPNNPDASMKEPVLSSSKVIFDRAYYWPHYAPITKAFDDDVTLYTLSKLTGHAGSRLGWAIVKDYDVYKRMNKYVRYNVLKVSHDTQLRAWQLLKAVIAGYEAKTPPQVALSPESHARDQHIFHFGHAVMKSRRERLKQVFARTKSFSLQPIKAELCSFFNSMRLPSPAYAWVRCKDKQADCYQVFREAGIEGRPGPESGGNSSYVRLSMLRSNDDFDQLIHRLNILLSK